MSAPGKRTVVEPLKPDQPRSAEEAIRMGRQFWFKPRRVPAVTAASFAKQVARRRVELAERTEQARLIRDGYKPPKGGDMYFVSPQCERGCAECSMACRIFLDWPAILAKMLKEDEAKLAGLRRQERRRKKLGGGSVIDLDERRRQRA